MNSGCPSPALGQSLNKTKNPQHSWEVGLEPTLHRGPGTWGGLIGRLTSWELTTMLLVVHPSRSQPGQKSFCNKERLRQQLNLKVRQTCPSTC
ncbi:rCG36154, isoform CRA_a [Rattus norvegicus]|uniref:RCG36154, isoform CRA_a n=1 Tax=Rattus norvegicus TaxID=10116 RepID=A6IK02_RAT|nr:rCG36154, isoform CRA_a [Rattus norvegicus]